MTTEVGERARGFQEARLSADTFTVFSLYQAARPGLPNKYVDAAKRFVTGLTAEVNGEDGPEFWGWMLEHLVEQLFDERRVARGTQPGFKSTSLCDTRFLAEREGGRVIGTVSVVLDDRGRGKKYGLEGVWVGGFNVLPEYQGRGLGWCLLYNILESVQLTAGSANEPVRVNLFTRNQTVGRMAAGLRFIRNEGLALDAADDGCSHYYRDYGERRPAR
jgi:GNAT superfamily N-acetyltransferase